MAELPRRMVMLADGSTVPIDGDEGMTKRERIAAMCLQGLLGQAWTGHFDDDERVKHAVQFADKLLQALEGKL